MCLTSVTAFWLLRMQDDLVHRAAFSDNPYILSCLMKITALLVADYAVLCLSWLVVCCSLHETQKKRISLTVLFSVLSLSVYQRSYASDSLHVSTGRTHWFTFFHRSLQLESRVIFVM
jgi:hypothetical protein